MPSLFVMLNMGACKSNYKQHQLATAYSNNMALLKSLVSVARVLSTPVRLETEENVDAGNINLRAKTMCGNCGC